MQQQPAIDYSRKWYVMAAVAMGVFLATIDGSIVNVYRKVHLRPFEEELVLDKAFEFEHRSVDCDGQPSLKGVEDQPRQLVERVRLTFRDEQRLGNALGAPLRRPDQISLVVAERPGVLGVDVEDVGETGIAALRGSVEVLVQCGRRLEIGGDRGRPAGEVLVEHVALLPGRAAAADLANFYGLPSYVAGG